MTNRTDNQTQKMGKYITSVNYNSCVGANSPIINGKLRLRANAVSHNRGSVTGGFWDESFVEGPRGANNFNDLTPPGLTASVASRSKERWNSNVRQGSGSLAVTLAQYGKARDMISGKVQAANGLLNATLSRSYRNANSIAKRLASDARRAGVTPAQQLARSFGGQYLEGTFGWVPLIQEAVALTGSVFEKAIPPIEISSQYSEYYDSWLPPSGQSPSGSLKISGTVKGRCHGFIKVVNPNANLLERTGATDIARAALDIVPWSWVVGMFVNTNAMLSDVRGLNPGLALTNTSFTLTVRCTSTQNKQQGSKTGLVNRVLVTKSRQLSLPTVGWRLKTPDMSLGLAAITVSLMAQRLGSYGRHLQSLARRA